MIRRSVLTRLPRRTLIERIDVIHFRRPLALHLDLATVMGRELTNYLLISARRNIHVPRITRGFHPLSRVYGVPPNVVGKLLDSHDPRHHGSRMNPYSHLE